MSNVPVPSATKVRPRKSKTLTRHPKPWYVYADKLRPQFSTMIVEICDDNGATVMPWSGFSATDLSHADQKALAKFIVEAVNETK